MAVVSLTRGNVGILFAHANGVFDDGGGHMHELVSNGAS